MEYIAAGHRKMLLDSAITEDVVETSGIRSTPTGIDFPWSDGIGATVWQHRPDKPKTDDEGREIKYVFPKGTKVPLNRLRDGDTYSRVIIAEGTKQSYAVLSHAPAAFAVYGMSGCWGWKNADLSVAKGRSVFLLLDADFTTNPGVYAAAEELGLKLTKLGAKEVRFVTTSGDGKQGVDDVLAEFPEDQRVGMLRLWLSQATAKLGKRPKAKRPESSECDAEAAKLFRQRDKPLEFQPEEAARLIMDGSPVAMTAEGGLSFYRDGVFVLDRYAVLAVVTKMLGNFYRPAHETVTERVLIGHAVRGGLVLPEQMREPLLNCPNGMVDLRDGKLLPHDPAYLSYVQVTTEYEPEQATPVYDSWLREALRQPHHSDADLDALVADIEETAGTMLDPSKTPSKALFLFGPSRSGKSTFLRLLKAVAGAANTSAVTLHNIARDNFATANLYGKMLNVAADLSNEHVADLSNFKMLTGEDVITANRKYGSQFTFTNQALIAFSANELPTVSEASRAYAERMKPFSFPNSFAGREDKTLEDKLMSELPGILARWVKAYGRFLARGGYGRTDARTQSSFEAKSDRVVQFVQDMCTVTEACEGERLGESEATKRRDVARAFNEWAERNGGSKMGERAFFQRISQIEGVAVIRFGPKQVPGFNLTVAKSDDDRYEFDGDEPVADPVAPSGVVEAEGNPWASPAEPEQDTQEAVSAPVTPAPVPAATEPVNEPQNDADGFAAVQTDDGFDVVQTEAGTALSGDGRPEWADGDPFWVA